MVMNSDLYESLRSSAKTFVPPSCPTIALPTVMVVGEQPGRMEVANRKPFQGPAGKLLHACLKIAGFNSANIHFTNVIKDIDQELDAYCKAPKSRRQSPQWSTRANSYLNLLRDEINLSSAKLIIPVGNVALQATTGRWGITKWRGSPLSCLFNEEKHVLPTIHPSSILRGASEDKFLFIQDLKKAKTWLDNNFVLTQRSCITKPPLDEVYRYLDLCYELGLEGNPIAFDIEIKNLELNCISFAIRPGYALCIPFVGPKGDMWTPPEEVQIMKMIAKILTSPSIRKQGQNLIFDTHFLLRKYGIRTVNLDDSMIAEHTLFPQLPKGLDLITSLWTDIPYYKDDGKDWMRGGGTYDKLWVYNCLDSVAVQDAFPKIMRNLSLSDNLPAYERQLSIVAPCCYMMERGIKVNIERLRQEREIMRAEANVARRQLADIAPGLNINSPKQMQDYFYGRLGIKPYLNKKRKVSADAEALKRIARKKGVGSQEASLILSIKKKEKLISTYLEDVKFDDDGRIRCSYNPVGTTYSRLSSSQSIFGTGMNMQNWPHSMLRFLEPDPGYVAYTMDLSQAENRIVAYVGRIENMIKAFETNQDVHRLTAGLIFNKSPEDISDEPGSSDLGNGESTERQWGKKANHSLNYDFGYRSFAMLYEMTEKDAKWIVDRYHAVYPEVRQNFHALCKKMLRESKTITNLMGRKTIFLTDLDDETFKASYSCIPQGTVGDVVNERGLAYIYHNPNLFGSVELLQQVHDSITFQIPLTCSWLEHATFLNLIKASLETPLTTQYGRQFVIPVDTVMGLNLMKEDGIELKSKKWPATNEELATRLEEGYNKLIGAKNAA